MFSHLWLIEIAEVSKNVCLDTNITLASASLTTNKTTHKIYRYQFEGTPLLSSWFPCQTITLSLERKGEEGQMM